MSEKTLSLHGGRMASMAHNRREQGHEGKYSTIKNELTQNNVTLIDIDVREAYKQLFSEAVDEYNKTQRRSDRKIKNYYTKIRSDKKKNTHYEYIFQLGNTKNRIDDDTFIAVCSDYVASFQKRNPNLYLIGAYIHLDEEASPHMHLDYIPIAHYDKGMKLQTSSNKAFEELTGYKSQSHRDTAQIKWQESEREYVKEFCKQYDIEIIDGDSRGKKSLSVAEYKAMKDMEQAQTKIAEAKIIEQNAEQAVQRAQTRVERAVRDADKAVKEQHDRVKETKKETEEQIDALEEELSDAQERFDAAKHKMNMKYKENEEELDKVVAIFNCKIQELHELANKFELNEFNEQAKTLERAVKKVMQEEYER